jgi:hypothetical protein
MALKYQTCWLAHVLCFRVDHKFEFNNQAETHSSLHHVDLLPRFIVTRLRVLLESLCFVDI